MPSYKNYKNNYRKDAQSNDVFRQPKSMKTAKEFSSDRRERLIDWITFYRKNVHRFIEHYLQIKLHPYQIIWVYLMSISDSFVAICSRAVGKTWLLAVFACARAILYPNSEIVVVSSTKEQAGIIVSDKISSLVNDHPNLAREIKNIVTNMNKWQVDFHNGSVLKIVASRDSSRGKRSTFTIYEEFRLIDKSVLDAVIRPFAYIRQTPYLNNPKYEHLIEEPKEVFISSAYHKGLWWFDETKRNIKAMLQGDNSRFIALDYLLAIEHKIKTARQIKNEKSKMDEVTALEEYDNIPWGESADAYFKLKMFTRSRTISKAFYPQRVDTYNAKKNPYDIDRSAGELRVVSCDIAQRAGKANDLSITSCIRLLPTNKGYFRELLFMESFSGVDSITQSTRIKQLFYDFDGDAIVMDVASAGIAMYDQLGQITKDGERGVEYPAMTVMKHESIDTTTYEELLGRTLGLNALPIIYPISVNLRMNSDIAVQMRDKLQKRMWGFLADEPTAEDYWVRSKLKKEFLDNKPFFLSPYVQTSLLVNESINLSLSMLSGNVRLTENAGSRKDRYTSLSYGNYYISLLDQELLRISEDWDEWAMLEQITQIV